MPQSTSVPPTSQPWRHAVLFAEPRPPSQCLHLFCETYMSYLSVLRNHKLKFRVSGFRFQLHHPLSSLVSLNGERNAATAMWMFTGHFRFPKLFPLVEFATWIPSHLILNIPELCITGTKGGGRFGSYFPLLLVYVQKIMRYLLPLFKLSLADVLFDWGSLSLDVQGDPPSVVFSACCSCIPIRKCCTGIPMRGTVRPTLPASAC